MRPGSKGRNARIQSNSQDRPKSEMFKKVEMLEKKFEDFKKSQNEIKEILKNKLISLWKRR